MVKVKMKGLSGRSKGKGESGGGKGKWLAYLRERI